MKFSCLKENLVGVIKVFSSISSKNINLPILKNLLISAEDHSIKLIATNLELAIKAFIRGKVEEKGDFTVPIKLLSDYISLVDTDKIEFELKNNELKLSSKNSETRIKGMGSSDFPVVPQIETKQTFKVFSSFLKEALDKINFAVSTNELRPEISGVLFKFLQNELILVGTDSFRLAEKKLKLDEKKFEGEIIIPLSTILELQKILATNEGVGEDNLVEIILGNNQVLFKKNSLELISRVIDGVYPNYSQIIPNKFLTEAVVPLNQLLKTIKISGLFSKSGVFDIALSFEKDNLIISSNDNNIGAHNSSLPAQITGNTNKIVLNHRFLLDGLNAINTQNVSLRLIDGSNPLMVENYHEDKENEPKERDYLYLVMPIRQ